MKKFFKYMTVSAWIVLTVTQQICWIFSNSTHYNAACFLWGAVQVIFVALLVKAFNGKLDNEEA